MTSKRRITLTVDGEKVTATADFFNILSIMLREEAELYETHYTRSGEDFYHACAGYRTETANELYHELEKRGYYDKI